MTQRGRTLLGAGVAALVLAADQASKYAVLNLLNLPEVGDIPLLPPVLDLAMVWNHGVTFGLLQSSARGQIVLGIVALAVVAGLALWLRRAETAIVASALGAIAGGALVVVQGWLADSYGLQWSFLLTAACELYTLFYAVWGSRTSTAIDV